MHYRKLSIGDKFGRLEIAEYLGLKNGKKNYLCNCSCGNTVEVASTHIGRRVKSCGCLQEESRKRIIPAGSRFGCLEVLGLNEPTELGNRYRYLCLCKCGNTVIVRGDCLRSGETKSCGCIKHDTAVENLKTAYDTNFVNGTNIPRISMKTPLKNNTSGINGVSWNKRRQRWCVRVSFKGKSYFLGEYKDIEDAAKARKEAENRIFGEFLEWYAANRAKSNS